MYRTAKNYDQLIRLVGQHRPDQLTSYHRDIAAEMQREGNFKASEKHLLAVHNCNLLLIPTC